MQRFSSDQRYYVYTILSYLKSARGRAELKDCLKKTLASKVYMPYKLIR